MPDSFERTTPEIRDKYSFLAYKSCSANLPAAQKCDSDSETPIVGSSQHTDSEAVPTHTKRVELILQEQASYLRSIRNMLLFFTTLACIGLVAAIIFAFITTAKLLH